MKSLVLKKCKIEDIEDILRLQDSVFEDISSEKEILRKNTKQDFEKCFGGKNVVIGAYDDSEMVGIAILADVAGTLEDLAAHLLNHKVDNAANAKLFMIKKAYYGGGFQSDMLCIVEKLAYKYGFEHLCATVSPHNSHSKNNIIKAGFEFDHSEEKYGGLMRDIWVKEINVADYNKKIIEAATSLEGKTGGNELTIEGVDLNKCYPGQLELCTTGDVLEYCDQESGETFYGLFIDKGTPQVLIYLPNQKTIETVEVDTAIGSLRFVKAWLNPIGR